MDELEQRLARLREISPEPTTSGAQIRQVSGLRWRRQLVGGTIAAVVAIGGGAWGAYSMINHANPAPSVSATPLTPTLPPAPSTPPPISVTTAAAPTSPTEASPTQTPTRTAATPSPRQSPTPSTTNSSSAATPDPTAAPTRSASTAPSLDSASPSAPSSSSVPSCLEAEKKAFCLNPDGWTVTASPNNSRTDVDWSEEYTYTSGKTSVVFSSWLFMGGDASECVPTDTHHVIRATSTRVKDGQGRTVYVATVVSHEGDHWVVRTALVNKPMTTGETFTDCEKWLIQAIGVTGVGGESQVSGAVEDQRTFTSEEAAMKAARGARHTQGFDLLTSLHSQ